MHLSWSLAVVFSARTRTDRQLNWNRYAYRCVQGMSFHNAEGLSSKERVLMQSGSATILVVEDEILIRMDVVDQLTALGYDIIEAPSGRDALEALRNTDDIRILFTDVDMPGDLDGIMLAHEVSRTWPEIGIIVTSGKAALDDVALPQGSRFCSKPYIPTAVHAAIQEMLD